MYIAVVHCNSKLTLKRTLIIYGHLFNGKNTVVRIQAYSVLLSLKKHYGQNITKIKCMQLCTFKCQEDQENVRV